MDEREGNKIESEEEWFQRLVARYGSGLEPTEELEDFCQRLEAVAPGMVQAEIIKNGIPPEAMNLIMNKIVIFFDPEKNALLR